MSVTACRCPWFFVILQCFLSIYRAALGEYRGVANGHSGVLLLALTLGLLLLILRSLFAGVLGLLPFVLLLLLTSVTLLAGECVGPVCILHFFQIAVVQRQLRMKKKKLMAT